MATKVVTARSSWLNEATRRLNKEIETLEGDGWKPLSPADMEYHRLSKHQEKFTLTITMVKEG